MIIKVNDHTFIQTRNILQVEDDPKTDSVEIYYNTSTQMTNAHGKFSGQDRKDVLKALERATFDPKYND